MPLRSSTLALKRARHLRRVMTEPEVMLGVRLRKHGEDRPVFRRQHPIGPYILDFYCPAARLAVEVDGAQHSEDSQIAHDERRDAWLRREGLEVYRISASGVFDHADEVADGVLRTAYEREAALQKRRIR